MDGRRGRCALRAGGGGWWDGENVSIAGQRTRRRLLMDARFSSRRIRLCRRCELMVAIWEGEVNEPFGEPRLGRSLALPGRISRVGRDAVLFPVEADEFGDAFEIEAAGV